MDISERAAQWGSAVAGYVSSPLFVYELIGIFSAYFVAFITSQYLNRNVTWFKDRPEQGSHTLVNLGYGLGQCIFPLVAITLLKIANEITTQMDTTLWLIRIAWIFALMLFLEQCIRLFVSHALAAKLLRLVGFPIVFLHLVGILPLITEAMSAISVSVGNISLSAYGVIRAIIFGSLLFWMGRASNDAGQNIIRNHDALDVSTKEVFSKLLEVALFCIVFLLLLNIMGINLTALAVFGGAVGVGLGLGLQSIASNFISGVIILLDKSLTVGDFVELDDGSKGFVREFRMRYAVLETYDGKDILVPNEKFINSLMVNWTHKDPKQRYRVDFSVAYNTDIRAMVDLIKEVVAQHPQVISGDDIPFEERPDCEIDSFGDSGVNMFVEFWMVGVDDGKNRVGGDLLLMIFEALRENNIEVPFPQREVRILNSDSP